MSFLPRDWKRSLVLAGLMCAPSFIAAGCGDPLVNSGVAHPGRQPDAAPSVQARSGTDAEVLRPDTASVNAGPVAVAPTESTAPSEGRIADATGEPAAKPAPDDPARPRIFNVEGPNGALRLGFDDLDLMKLINMDPVTSDCIEKMPAWLRGLSGKEIRIRGYMKPSLISENIPEFIFVRSTDLCCFGPKGKVYHLIAVKLKEGTTTDYIELKPFDVVGRFRIEKIDLDEEMVLLLYHIDDAAIIRK